MTAIERHLGQKSAYEKEYNPSLLVTENRQSNRTYLEIGGDNPIPFDGYDIWNAYEVSALNNNGVPFSFVVKIIYSCLSRDIVESKSLKLYFNSFAMTKCGATGDDVREYVASRATADLTILLDTVVHVKAWHQCDLIGYDGFECEHPFITLERLPDVNEIVCTQYSESKDLLRIVEAPEGHIFDEWQDLHSSSLVSCCKVTSQPDSGDIFISYKSDEYLCPKSLLQYIVSFRNENHFHEEICEAVFKRLLDVLKPSNLAVYCLYSRRGGIDINPHRYFGEDFELPSMAEMIREPYRKLPRQ